MHELAAEHMSGNETPMFRDAFIYVCPMYRELILVLILIYAHVVHYLLAQMSGAC